MTYKFSICIYICFFLSVLFYIKPLLYISLSALIGLGLYNLSNVFQYRTQVQSQAIPLRRGASWEPQAQLSVMGQGQPLVRKMHSMIYWMNWMELTIITSLCRISTGLNLPSDFLPILRPSLARLFGLLSKCILRFLQNLQRFLLLRLLELPQSLPSSHQVLKAVVGTLARV